MSKPRFYVTQTTRVSDGERTATVTRMCMPGFNLKEIERSGRDPKAMTALKNWLAVASKGCTIHQEVARGSVSFEESCDDERTSSHSKTWGTQDDLRTHSTFTIKGIGPNREDVVTVSDERMRYVGGCPPSVKPGQFVSDDRKALDLAAPSHAAQPAPSGSAARR